MLTASMTSTTSARSTSLLPSSPPAPAPTDGDEAQRERNVARRFEQRLGLLAEELEATVATKRKLEAYVEHLETTLEQSRSSRRGTPTPTTPASSHHPRVSSRTSSGDSVGDSSARGAGGGNGHSSPAHTTLPSMASMMQAKTKHAHPLNSPLFADPGRDSPKSPATAAADSEVARASTVTVSPHQRVIDDLVAKHGEMRRELSSLQRELGSTRRELASSQRELASARGELAASHENREEAARKVKTLERQAEEAHEALRSSDKSLGILKLHNTELEAKLAGTHEANGVDDQRLQGLRDRVDALATINQALEADAVQDKERLAALEAANEVLQASSKHPPHAHSHPAPLTSAVELDALRAEAATTDAVTSGLRSMLEQSDSSRLQLSAERDRLSQENAALQAATAAREDELARVNEALKEGERLLVSLEAKLVAVGNENQGMVAQLEATAVELGLKDDEAKKKAVVTADLEATVSAMAQLVSGGGGARGRSGVSRGRFPLPVTGKL